MLRYGFKSRANKIARRARQLLRLAAHEPLDPFAMAKQREIEIAPLSSFAATHQKAVAHLMETEPSSFSACTIAVNENYLVILNDAHAKARQHADLAHELAHIVLKHPLRPIFDARGCRHLDRDAEDEADWLGPALLVSDEAALHIAREALQVSEAAKRYGVSAQLMQFRLNVTAAHRRVA